MVGTIVELLRCLGLRYSGDTVSALRGAVDDVARACDIVDDDLDFLLWRGPAGPKVCLVRDDGHRPDCAVGRAALRARHRPAHLGMDRRFPTSTVPRRGGRAGAGAGGTLQGIKGSGRRPLGDDGPPGDREHHQSSQYRAK